MNHNPRRLALAVLVAAPLGLAGCSLSVGETETIASTSVQVGGAKITAADIEKEAVAEFADRVPAGATVECPDDLKGEKGATTRCTWTLADKSTLGMTVTVTSFTESTGNYRLSLENDTKVTPAP